MKFGRGESSNYGSRLYILGCNFGMHQEWAAMVWIIFAVFFCVLGGHCMLVIIRI